MEYEPACHHQYKAKTTSTDCWPPLSTCKNHSSILKLFFSLWRHVSWGLYEFRGIYLCLTIRTSWFETADLSAWSSARACVGFLRVLRLPPTVRRQGKDNVRSVGDFKLSRDVIEEQEAISEGIMGHRSLYGNTCICYVYSQFTDSFKQSASDIQMNFSFCCQSVSCDRYRVTFNL